MAGSHTHNDQIKIDHAHIGIVASQFNAAIVDSLLDACVTTLLNGGITQDDLTVVRVPGAFEIPVVAQRLLLTEDYDAVIGLGAVIRGDTPHFEYICRECARGLATLSIKHDRPVIFGVLTVDNLKQAEDRSGPIETNKGAEAAQAAIETILALREIKS